MNKLHTKRNYIKKNTKKFNKKVRSTYKKVFKLAKKIKKQQNKITRKFNLKKLTKKNNNTRKFKVRGGTHDNVMSHENLMALNKCLSDKQKLQQQIYDLQNEISPKTPAGFIRPIPRRLSPGSPKTPRASSTTPFGDIIDSGSDFYPSDDETTDDEAQTWNNP